MAKKHILQLEITHNFAALGIVSAQKDYRMCWLLNNQLEMDMKRISDFCHPPESSSEPVCFPVYHYNIPGLFLDVFLLPNKSADNVLFKEPRSLDYLLLFKGSGEHNDIGETLKLIRKIPQVQAAFELDQLPAKKAREFFFDFEMFLASQ